ncbi:hypothetical protein BH11BAC6_BH11BAC6_01160 [soil metagenome]
MTFYLPGWLWLFVAAALYIFYAVNKSNSKRKQHRRDHIKEKQEQLIALLRTKNEEDSTMENNAAE